VLSALLQQSYSSNTALQKQLNAVMAQRANDPELQAYSQITSRTTFELKNIPTNNEVSIAFNRIIQTYETRVNNWLQIDPKTQQPDPRVPAGFTIPGSNERLALVSLAYQSQLGATDLLGPQLREAIITGNRAEAWYEIRYNSNLDKKHGDRRYREADLFGLYGGNNQPVTEEEAIDMLRTLRVHQDKIDEYEGSHPVPAGSQYFRLLLQPTYGYLITHFNIGGSFEQVLVSLNALGGDPIQGTDASELLLGGISHDILIGGRGDDLLRGEGGKDVYVYNSGDGEDTILDTDGEGLVVFDHHLLQGGLKKQSDAFYESLDGQIRYQRSGDDLVVNGTLRIKDWQEGQFGIRLKDLPDDPQEPTDSGASRGYQYIDHYE
jgi:hypothetical protein